MNLKREMMAVHERLAKIEKSIASLLKETKPAKEKTTKKVAKKTAKKTKPLSKSEAAKKGWVTRRKNAKK